MLRPLLCLSCSVIPLIAAETWTASPVATDLLQLSIDAGRVVPSQLSDYRAEPGDAIDDKNKLKRGGREIGWVAGREREAFVGFERLEGGFDATGLEQRALRIASSDDPAWREARAPVTVSRKTKAIDWCEPDRGQQSLRHRLYLRLDRPLVAGRTYRITGDLPGLPAAGISYRHDPLAVSEAVHAIHTGYRADDPAKSAFVSLWMGAAGGLTLASGTRFSLIDETGTSAFTGTMTLAKATGTTETLRNTRDYVGGEVHRADFSAFTTPGTYRVAVDGVGTSQSFAITCLLYTSDAADDM
jgi:hypothetical protein